MLVHLRNPQKQIVKTTAIQNLDTCLVGGRLEPKTRIFDAEGSYLGIIEDDRTVSQTDPLSDILDQTEGDAAIAAHNFYHNWINTEWIDNLPIDDIAQDDFAQKMIRARAAKKRLLIPDFTIPDGVVITGAKTMKIGSQTPGKDDGGLLYVPEEGKVCVIPTISDSLDISPDCEFQESALEQDCLDSPAEVNNLISLIGICK